MTKSQANKAMQDYNYESVKFFKRLWVRVETQQNYIYYQNENNIENRIIRNEAELRRELLYIATIRQMTMRFCGDMV